MNNHLKLDTSRIKYDMFMSDCAFAKLACNYRCSENVGLLGLTHIGSRRVVQISTAFMIFFSIFGLFAFLSRVGLIVATCYFSPP